MLRCMAGECSMRWQVAVSVSSSSPTASPRSLGRLQKLTAHLSCKPIITASVHCLDGAGRLGIYSPLRRRSSRREPSNSGNPCVRGLVNDRMVIGEAATASGVSAKMVRCDICNDQQDCAWQVVVHDRGSLRSFREARGLSPSSKPLTGPVGLRRRRTRSGCAGCQRD